MTSGVPCKLTKTDIIDALTQTRGNIAAACRKLNYNRTSMHEFINSDPEILEVLNKAREIRDLDVVQNAVNDLLWFSNQKETKPDIAFKATVQILDRKGHLLNWNKPKD